MRFVKTVENLFGLPGGFKRVEYLESTGIQYIDTGYIPKPTSSYKCEFELTNIATTSGAWFCVFGSVESNNSVFTELFLPRASGGGNVNQVLVGNHNSTYIRNNYAWAINTPYDFEMTTTDVSINDVSQGSITVDSSVSCSHSIYLFARHEYNDAVRYNVSAKVRSFKVYEDNNLVCDFIPCIDPLGRPCMYDLVGKKPYYNQGTGDDFTIGRQIIPVEYLQSTGYEYIDTGYKLNSNSVLEVSACSTDATQSNNTLLGVGMSAGSADRVQVHFGSAAGTLSIRLDGTLSSNQSIGTNKFISKIDISNKKAYFNDAEIVSNYTGSIDTTDNIALFNRMISGNVVESEYAAKAKVYYLRISENNALVRDFIPCKDENNVGFMFDTVSGTVYENAGTGAFVVGQNKYKMKLRLIKDNILPTGYTQVEYLESTGTQYIDTGVGGDLTTELTCEAAIVQAGNASVTNIMGNNVTNTRAITINMSANITNPSVSRIRFGNTDTTTVAGSINLNTFYKYDTNKNKLTVRDSDGTILNTYAFNATTAFTTDGNILIFKLGDTSTQYIGKIKVKGATIKNSGVLVRNFIPAIDPSGAPCMYDLVSRTPFYNVGTGTFTTGKPLLPIVRFPVDPVPVGYKTVNYLESTGSQYIDTGVYPTQLTEAEYKCAVTGSVANVDSHLFGSRLSASSEAFDLAYMNTTPNGIEKLRFIHGTTLTQEETTSVTATQLKNPHTYYVSGTSFKVDGSEKMSFTTESFTGSYSLWLFGVNNAGSLHNQVRAQRVYCCKIWDNNTLVRNFIPVVRLLDNKAGMWDTVTKQFYTTPTGNFVTG